MPADYHDDLWTSVFDALLNAPAPDTGGFPLAELAAQFDAHLLAHPDQARSLKVHLCQQHMLLFAAAGL